MFNQDHTEPSTIQNIIDLSDELEARERTCEMRLPKTSHYHIDFDLNIGLTDSQILFLEREVKPRENIRTLTFQASKDCEKVNVSDGKYVPASRILSLKEQINNTINSVNKIRDIVGSERNIGIENNNYYASGAYDICTSKEFFVELGHKQVCHLLLDYAHAMVTCYNRQEFIDDYINTLIFSSKCLQVHLCQPAFKDSDLKQWMYDAHDLPSKELTMSAISLMKNNKIKYLTIEYYKNGEVLHQWLKWFKNLDNLSLQ